MKVSVGSIGCLRTMRHRAPEKAAGAATDGGVFVRLTPLTFASARLQFNCSAQEFESIWVHFIFTISTLR